jgi:Tfp pilus assembly protein PilN
MPNNKSAINLLPQEEFDVSILGRALKWAMGTFRIIVIATEMVVMAAFLSRFWLDAQNSDLINSIKIKSAQITAQAATENQFRSIQSKLSIAKQTAPTVASSQKVDLITSKVPPDITLTTVSVLEKSAQIKGVATGESGIAQFIANLKADTTFKTVDLGQINSSETNAGQLVFTVTISY